MRDVSRRFFDLPLARENGRWRAPAWTSRAATSAWRDESVGRSRDVTAMAGDSNESPMIGPVDPPDAAYAPTPPPRAGISRPIYGPMSRPRCVRHGSRTTAPWAAWPAR